MATTVTLKPNAIDISGSTSGTTTLQATAVAGTTTLTLPAATDTLVGKATTDTLTNKTLTGAAMNGTIGATTPSTGAFTTLSAGISTFSTTTSGAVVIANGTNATGGTFFQVQKSGVAKSYFGSSISISGVGTVNDTDIYATGSLRLFGGDQVTKFATLSSAGLAVTGLTDISAATSGQIKFPAAQNASADTNTLDDYEEGTWTPSSTGITVVGTFGSSGVYTKIGNVVTITATFNATTSVAVPAGASFSPNIPIAAANNAIDSPGTFFKFGLPGGEVIVGQNDTRFYTGEAISPTGSFQVSVTYFTA